MALIWVQSYSLNFIPTDFKVVQNSICCLMKYKTQERNKIFYFNCKYALSMYLNKILNKIIETK